MEGWAGGVDLDVAAAEERMGEAAGSAVDSAAAPRKFVLKLKRFVLHKSS